MITFDVLGTPAPKGNVRAFVNKKTGRAFVSSSGGGDRQKRQQSWEGCVRHAAVDAVVALGDAAPTGPVFVQRPIAVAITFRMTRPAGHWNKKGGLKPSAPALPATKPDIDKLVRCVLDVLTGLVFDDDSRVARLVVQKVYASPGTEGARITVEAA